jgi:hypothetical protein
MVIFVNKSDALKVGKKIGGLAWLGSKTLLRLSFVAIVFLATWWFKLLITAALGGYYSREEEEDESEWWWYQNHGDPMDIYDKDDK